MKITIDFETMSLAHHKGPKRKEGEDFEIYRLRRKKENEETKKYLKGQLFWESSIRGTYRRYPHA
jgi:hypothetical protein